MEYLKWKEEKIVDYSPQNISKMYDNGFVFTRLGKGIMNQTRSIRIDLEKFEPSSENRRILRKGENIIMNKVPIPFKNYKWEIGKIAKDFYDKKARSAFSVNKIKELLTTEHNFNYLYIFSDLGYSICYTNDRMLHYSYPFYNLTNSPKDMGLIMMTKTLMDAKNLGLKYTYLGSLQRPNDVYKLQFEGVEWFDGEKWNSDLDKVKTILNESGKH